MVRMHLYCSKELHPSESKFWTQHLQLITCSQTMPCSLFTWAMQIFNFLNIPKLKPSWLSIFSAAAAEKYPWRYEIAICWEISKGCKKILFPFCLCFQHNFQIGRFLENIPFWKQSIHFLGNEGHIESLISSQCPVSVIKSQVLEKTNKQMVSPFCAFFPESIF